MFSGDFVRLDEEAFKHASSGAGAEWSDQETLLLLEGVEMFDDDWQAVAEHVGTRSKEQCIGKFLQLPIEDPYIAADGQGGDPGPLKWQAGMNGLPFEGTENPVMSVVAFLASAVGPGVAAAAAQSALGELSQSLKRKRTTENGTAEVAEKTQKVDGQAEVKEEGEAMAVDGEQPPETTAEKESNGDEVATVTVAETNGHDAKEGDAPSQSAVERAASIALGAAAAKASALATHEDRRISQLVSRLVSAQVRKVELKLSMVERLESILEDEKRNVEQERQSVFREKLSVQKKLVEVEAYLKKVKEAPTSAPGAGVDLAAGEQMVQQGLGQTTAQQVQPVSGEAANLPPPAEGEPQASMTRL